MGRGRERGCGLRTGGGIDLTEPAGIDQIVFGDAFYLPGNEFRGDVFDLSCRNASIDRSGFYFGAFQHNGAGGDDRIFSYLGIVHNDGAHSDEDIVMDGAAVYDGVMTYGNVVADMNAGLFVCSVQDDAVLDIYPIAYVDTIDIASYHGIEPKAAFVANLYVAHDGGIGRDKTVFAKAGRFAFYREYRCHNYRVECLVNILINVCPANLRTLSSMKPQSDANRLFLRHVAQTSPNPLGLEIVKAEGVYLYDRTGKAYLDLIGGISVCNTGHRHPRVVQAVKDQADRYLHLLVYGELVQSPQVDYATLLAAHLPPSLEAVYFTNSGAEAVEGAMKLAKRVTGRWEILAFRQSYHGSTQGALSIMGDEYWRNAFRPLLPGIRHLEYNSPDAVDAINGQTACVIVETVQAERGIFVPQGSWLQELRKRCDETGALLVFDEIQAGFGRTGTLWGFERYDVVPDILLLGKALGGGLPMGAFIAGRERMWALTGDPVLGHITTFGGHPLCCAAGLAAMQVLLESGWIAQVAEKEALFRRLLVHPAIRAVRSCGLLVAVEFDTFEQNKRIIDACIAAGLLTDWYLFAPHCLRIAPPLSITNALIEKACSIILSAI